MKLNKPDVNINGTRKIRACKSNGKKITKTSAGKDNIVWFHTATTKNSSTVTIPEEFLKALGQMKPRDFVNIIVN